jgi:HK97 gp10 family phage protein
MSDFKVTSYVQKAIKANAAGTRKGMITTAINVTSQAKSLAPVDKGQLRGSIMYKAGTGEEGGLTEGQALTGKVDKGSIIVGSAVEHAVYQEYGTRKMAAQPFLRPAVAIVTAGQTAVKAMREAMQDSVRVVLGIDKL